MQNTPSIGRNMLLLLGLLPILSCQSLPRYVEPSAGPTAAIRFATAGTKVGATIYSDTQCSNPGYISSNGQFLKIPANKALTINRGFSSVGLPYGTTCNITSSFVPQPGKRYEMEFIHGSPQCFLTLVELDESGAPIKSDREFVHPIFGTVGKWPIYLPLQKVVCPEAK